MTGTVLINQLTPVDEASGRGPVVAATHEGGPARRARITREIMERTGIDVAVIERFVRRFYRQVQADPLLGPVFAPRMKVIAKLVAAALACGSLAMPVRAQNVDDAPAVRQMMMQTFDKPDAPLTVEPVTVEADIAVAGRAQGERGGRALLRKKGSHWSLVLCSGDALKDSAALQQFGLTPQQAKTLASAASAAEAKLNPALVEKFSRFDGIVMMDGEGHHPPVDADGSSRK